MFVIVTTVWDSLNCMQITHTVTDEINALDMETQFCNNVKENLKISMHA